MKITKKNLRNTGITIVGTFILALSLEMFIIPFDILSGGVAGISVALYPVFHINITLMANILILSLLAVGGIFLGKEFFINTCISSLTYPVFTTLLMHRVPIPEISQALAAFYGGLLGGIGVGLVMRTGASTGGTDIPVLILHKLTGISISGLALAIDGLVVLLGWAGYGLSSVLIGMISVFSCSFAIKEILSMNGVSSKSVQIISEQWQKILERTSAELERGATLFTAQGGFRGEEKKVLLIAVSDRQYPILIDMINEIDPHAFVITTDASDMHGEGFTYPSHL